MYKQVLRLAACYNGDMTPAEDINAYMSRWKAIEAVQQEERRSASFELRWQQLNTAYGMAKGLGLLKPDPSEAGVFARWAKLKEKVTSQPRIVSPRS